MSDIHRTAIVEDGARIGDGVTIGPYTTIGPEVVIGDNVSIAGHVDITGRTEIGARTTISPFAAIGHAPQDTSYKGEPCTVRVGTDCVIREHATIHRGTVRGRGHTEVGSHVFMMVASHVAHDCVVADHVTLVNNATLGGHVEVGEYAILGGLAAVQQRIRVGAYAFVGGVSGVSAEVIPYAITIGDRAELAGLNIVGLKRRGFDRPTIHALRGAYKQIFFGRGTLDERVERAAEAHAEVEPVMRIIEFIRGGGKRPLCLPRNAEV